MTIINYVLHDGTVQSVEAADGDSVMIVAMRNNFEGILAECGGACCWTLPKMWINTAD